jgi:hypothetical protein
VRSNHAVRRLLITLLVLAACETVPVTRRSQHLLVSEGEEAKMDLDAIARHGGERMSQEMLVQSGLAATQAALARNEPLVVQSVTALLGAGASAGLILPFSRRQASEANHLGLIYMTKAGLARPAFLSTHPSAATG